MAGPRRYPSFRPSGANSVCLSYPGPRSFRFAIVEMPGGPTAPDAPPLPASQRIVIASSTGSDRSM